MKKTMFKSLIATCVCICIFIFGTLCAEASPYQLGDVDTDGSVNAGDALLALQSAAQIRELDADQTDAADVNKDGVVSAEDGLQILKVAAKLDIFRIPVTLTVGGDPYTIDKIFDAGAYVWNYTLTPESGLTVTKELKELSEGSQLGMMAEQVYTIQAQEAGTYELHFRLCPVGRPEEAADEEMLFEFHVKEANALTPYALSEAEYPKMALYPANAANFDDPAYEAWRRDVANQRRDLGDISALQNFFKESAATFLKDTKGENKIYSPLNVYMALSMLAQTTAGESQEQILTLLGSPDMAALRKQASDIWNCSYRDDGAMTTILASSLWLNKNVKFQQNTLKTLAEDFYASAYQGEMGSAAFDQALQDWLDLQTGGLLKEQAAGIKMDPETVLSMAATIYYKAKWDNEFSANSTTPQTFHTPNGDIETDFLHQREAQAYYWGDHFAAVSQKIALGGDMWFLLPDENIDPETLLSDEEAMAFLFTAQKDKWTSQKELQVNKAIPKFDVASSFDLKEGLKTLGVTDVFDTAKADFTPLTTDETKFALAKADHEARVMIDEKGCKAAAFTVLMYPTAPEPPKDEVDFVLDRPFLFCITGENGLPLFVGVVNAPVAK